MLSLDRAFSAKLRNMAVGQREAAGPRGASGFWTRKDLRPLEKTPAVGFITNNAVIACL